MKTFTEEITLQTVSCLHCAGTFALNARWLEHKRKNSGWYHCPYCEGSQGWGESEADRLRKEIEQRSRELTAAKSEALRATHQRDEESKAKLEALRQLGRVNKGVCPCCNRQFKNLARHMAVKHKTMKADAKGNLV